MRFSNKQAKKNLKILHDRECPILLGIIGVSPKEIDVFFNEDDETRKSDRRFYRHQPDKGLHEFICAAPDDDDESNLMSLDEPDMINLATPDELDAVLNIQDQIEDPRLLAAWMSLSLMDRKIIVLHDLGGYSLKEIAARWGLP